MFTGPVIKVPQITGEEIKRIKKSSVILPVTVFDYGIKRRVSSNIVPIIRQPTVLQTAVMHVCNTCLLWRATRRVWEGDGSSSQHYTFQGRCAGLVIVYIRLSL